MKIIWQLGDVTVHEVMNYTAGGYLPSYIVRENNHGKYCVFDEDRAIQLAKELVEGITH